MPKPLPSVTVSSSPLPRAQASAATSASLATRASSSKVAASLRCRSNPRHASLRASVRSVPGPPARSRFDALRTTPSTTTPGNPRARRSARGRRTTSRATSSTSFWGVIGQTVRIFTRSLDELPTRVDEGRLERRRPDVDAHREGAVGPPRAPSSCGQRAHVESLEAAQHEVRAIAQGSRRRRPRTTTCARAAVASRCAPRASRAEHRGSGAGRSRSRGAGSGRGRARRGPAPSKTAGSRFAPPSSSMQKVPASSSSPATAMGSTRVRPVSCTGEVQRSSSSGAVRSSAGSDRHADCAAWSARERERPAGQQVDGGLVSRDQEQDRRGEQLAVAEAVLAVMGGHERREQVVAGVAPARLEQALEVHGEVREGLVAGGCGRRAAAGTRGRGRARAPPRRRGTRCGPRRGRRAARRSPRRAAARRSPSTTSKVPRLERAVQEQVGLRGDEPAERRDRARGERALDQAPQPSVVRRVAEQERPRCRARPRAAPLAHPRARRRSPSARARGRRAASPTRRGGPAAPRGSPRAARTPSSRRGQVRPAPPRAARRTAGGVEHPPRIGRVEVGHR